MINKKWSSWLVQTASRWEDIDGIIEFTGVGPVDNEHIRLIEYIIEVNRIVSERVTRMHHFQMQLETIESFAEFTKRHFAHEETLIETYNLPSEKEQKEEHAHILGMFNTMIADFQGGKLHIAQEGRLKLQLALVDHINSTDLLSFDLGGLLASMDEMNAWPELPYFMNDSGVDYLDASSIAILQKIIRITKSKSTESTEVKQALFDEVIQDVQAHFQKEEDFLKEHNLLQESEKHAGREDALSLLKTYKKQLKRKTTKEDDLSQFAILKRWMTCINIVDAQYFSFRLLVQKLEAQKVSVDEVAWMIRTTGHKSLDREHKEFVAIVTSITKKLSNDQRDQKFAELLLHVTSHFSHEEKILKDMHHPDVSRHAAEHQVLLQHLVDYIKLFDTGAVEVSSRFRYRLIDLWLSHINGLDYQSFILHKKLMEVNA